MNTAELHPCDCGCGQLTETRFVPNHHLKHMFKTKQVIAWGVWPGESPSDYMAPEIPPAPTLPSPYHDWMRRLLHAALDEAVTHIKRCKTEQCYRCASDMRWIEATAANFPFAFEVICEVLNLPAEKIRTRYRRGWNG